MANLTSKELTAIDEQLSQEQLLVKKFKMYASQATDPEIKTKCENIAAQHQGHYEMLMNNLC